MQITIGGETTILALPRSATVRLELASAVRDGQISLRTAAAAIGCCWPSRKGRPAKDFDGGVADYGRAVADDLIARGATMAQIVTTGAACIEAIFDDGLPGMTEVAAAAGPTEAHAEGTPSTA